MPVKLLSSAKFDRNVRGLAKHHPKAVDDVESILQQLRSGATPGDRIPGVRFSAYKVRVKSSDMTRGENAAFRLIYYVQTKECIYLVTIYPKPANKDIGNKELKRMIENIFRYEDLKC